MRTDEIRRRFLDHFRASGHTVVPSASLIADDATLLLVNAGMVPFKPYFLGEQRAPYKRAASVQKCVRTLDIDEVGKTDRHASFFQMNGNFSFGDYFKAGAIPMAWELLTKSQSDGGFGFDEAKLWVTVYLDDDEAADIWRNDVGVKPERIQRLGKAENYWSMMVPGPCGPCSEIFYDRGPRFGREGGPAVDDERFMEVWNLVFMQNIRGEGSDKEDYPILGDLPAKNIDTGMGMERMASVLQGVDNLYEIDQVRPILDKAADITATTYGRNPQDDVRLRVIADHVRSALMIISDGVTPANEGRGYVLRRMLRRSVRSLRLLGLGEPGLPALLPVARDCMSASYPEVESDFERISGYAYAEERVFLDTLKTGTSILDLAVAEAKAGGSARLPGDRAFALHDTYGFPIDLTLEMAAEQGLAVDEDGFRALMAEQKRRAKADNVAKKTGRTDLSVFRELAQRAGESRFTGYDETERTARLTGLLVADAPAEAAQEGDEVALVLDATPFYAEGGGQEPDHGRIVFDGGAVEIDDVQSVLPGLMVHRGRVVTGELRAGGEVRAQVDVSRRQAVSRSHTATHLVHRAIRVALGDSATQAGSLNAPGRLRFDFANPSAVPGSLLADVEEEVNEVLLRDLPVTALVTTQDEARRMGAMALFGEKYGERVRVVDVGDYSRELCGGTHVGRSTQLGMVKLLGESSIGAGVRRVEALVGLDAFRFLAREHVLISQLAGALKVPADQIPERVAETLVKLREAEKALEKLRADAVLGAAAELAAGADDVDGTALVTFRAPDGTGADDLRALALDVRGRLGEGRPAVVVVGAENAGRAMLVAATNGAARTAGARAGGLIKALAPLVGGGGGGKDDVAQGGGTDPAGLPAALAQVGALVRE